MKKKTQRSAFDEWAERFIRNDCAIREAREKVRVGSDEIYQLHKVHDALMAELIGLVGDRIPAVHAILQKSVRNVEGEPAA